MAFCSNCGHQLTGNEKFCAECGASTATKTAAAPGANLPPAPGPVPVATPISQPIVSTPYPGTPAGLPVLPPVQPAQKKGKMGTVVIVILVALAGYYFYNKSHTSAAPAPTPVPAAQNPPASSPGSGSGGGNAELVKQQDFTAHWQDKSGMLWLTTGTWANNSNTNITSATLQCRQFNAAGTDLSEYRVTLTGPEGGTKAGTSSQFSNISLGATATGMSKVDCAIIHVKPAS
jgi:hypothetical protein